VTPKERLDYIAQLTTGWAEQSKREHEEDYRLLQELRDEARAIERRMEERDRPFREEMAADFAEMRREMEARDRITDQRIRELVVASGELVRRLPANGKH
jgi:hypothetical protein